MFSVGQGYPSRARKEADHLSARMAWAGPDLSGPARVHTLAGDRTGKLRSCLAAPAHATLASAHATLFGMHPAQIEQASGLAKMRWIATLLSKLSE